MIPESGDQRRYFVRSLVPELFFANPDGFLDLLDSGDRYLNFLWDRAGEVVGRGVQPGSDRVSGEVAGRNRVLRLGLISLPEPLADKDTIFVGLAIRPPRLTLSGIKRPSARMFTLELSVNPDGQSVGWIFSEQSRTGVAEILPNTPPRPEAASFLDSVRSTIEA